MNIEEKRARIAELLANEDRQPADDQELEKLRSEVDLTEKVIVELEKDEERTGELDGSAAIHTEVPMSVLKEQAKAKGIMYRVGMTKAALLNAIREIEKRI